VLFDLYDTAYTGPYRARGIALQKPHYSEAKSNPVVNKYFSTRLNAGKKMLYSS